MRVYKSYPQAFMVEIFIATLTMLGVSLWGSTGLLIIALFVLRPLVLKIEKKDVDESFSHKHYKIFKLSTVLTAVTIILVYGISDLYFHTKINSDFLLRMILPYFILLHGCIGIIYFRK